MATLVLTTVGTMIGGPVGGSIGALIGQAVDAKLFAPKGREGPRLNDLRVQTSSYGTPIPRLYGRMRVAGTVIWATDLVEHRHRQGGKGRPATTSYSYSASFAVALSSRPVRSVGRIWAEGTILRGGAGDFKSAATFRLHHGDEDQPVDPLIAAVEGVGHCPAFRGIAYAMFEDMDLAPFGNRIPSLNFEVEADAMQAAGLSIGVPMADVLRSAEPAAALPFIGGAALAAPSRRSAIEPLARIVMVNRPAGDADWRLGEDAQEPALRLGEPAAETGSARPSRTLGDGSALPRHMGLSLFDPSRDWQVAVQQARVPGGLGQAETLALPLAMEAQGAKALNARLARDAARQMRRSEWPAGFAALAAPPGAAVVTAGVFAGTDAGRVSERRIEGAGVRLTIEAARSGGLSHLAADGGRVLGSPDLLIGPSRGWLFDLPLIDGMARDGGSHLVLAAAGDGPGWRQAAVSLVSSEGAIAQAMGSVTAMSVLGEVIAISGEGQPWLFDRAGAVTVMLLRDDMDLANADDAAMLAGANLAAAGHELFQFGHAERIGPRQWRLTQLLRGRFSTEDAMSDPAQGRGFALIGDVALMPLPATMQVGGAVLIEGQGDSDPVTLPVTKTGRALRPLSPVRLVPQWQQDGALSLRWTRRSRIATGWVDLIDAPLDERVEQYLVTLAVGPAVGPDAAMVIERDEASLLIDAATLAGWRTTVGAGAVLAVSVVQIGAAGVSPPLFATLAI